MKVRINIAVALIVYVIVSCNSNITVEYQEFSFMPEIYPYTDTVYAEHHNEMPFYNLGQIDKPKLIFYTYGDCSSCFSKIINWQKFVKDNFRLLENVEYAIVIYTERVEILEYNLEKIDNSIPLYIDTLQAFSNYNNTVVEESLIILLSNENRIMYSTLKNETDIKNFNQILKHLKKIQL